MGTGIESHLLRTHQRRASTVFDSSGTALQDVAAAIAVYQRALPMSGGERFHFNV